MNDTMATEIAAQAETLPDCLAPLVLRVNRIARPAGWVMAGGCGDSAFAPAAMKGFFDATCLQIEPTTAMQLAGFTRFIAGDGVILSSISGNTRRTVEAAHVAKTSGARVIALTCGEDSALARIADETIILPFTPISRRTPHTLDYLVTIEALAVLGLHWCGESIDPLQEVLAQVPRWLEAAREFAEVAVTVMNPDGKIFLLGAGPDLATAAYGAAKFHEAGGIPALAAETENFIHGMNFMAEPADLAVRGRHDAPVGTAWRRSRRELQVLSDKLEPDRTGAVRGDRLAVGHRLAPFDNPEVAAPLPGLRQPFRPGCRIASRWPQLRQSARRNPGTDHGDVTEITSMHKSVTIMAFRAPSPYASQSGFRPASICLRRPSRNGGSESFSPSASSDSSVAKPGPSVAISNRMPFGSRK